MLVAHIVQAGHLVVPAAAVAAKTATKASPAARLLPIIILIGLLFVFTRYRRGTQQRRMSGTQDPPATRRPRSAREAMRQPAPPRDSDTDPESRSEHTQTE